MSKHKKQFKLLAAGDFHGDKLAAKKLADLAEKENVDLVVLNGDLVEEEDTSGIIGPFVAKNKKSDAHRLGKSGYDHACLLRSVDEKTDQEIKIGNF